MWSLIGALAKGLLDSLLGLVLGRVQRAEDKLQGMNDQKVADDAATLAAAIEGARAGSEVAGESDAAVIADLQKDVQR